MSNWAKLQEDLMGKPVFKRAKHGIHFKNNDGSITANFSGKPCHYLDGGLWKPIDTKLLPLGDGFYGCPHSPVKVHPDGRVKVEGYQQRAELPSAKVGKADNDKLIREFSFGSQELRITEDGFRSEITLNRIPTLTEARKLIASESGTLSKKYLKSLTTATDANGDVHVVTTLAAFRTWLAKAVFPVVIDPDFAGETGDGQITGLSFGGTYAASRSTSLTSNVSGTTFIVGQMFETNYYYVSRGYVLFDTSSIGAGSTVTQANLKMVCTLDESTTADFDIQIVKYDWSQWAGAPTNTTYRETAYDGCLAGDADDNIWRNTSGISINTQYASGNLAVTWVSKTGITYYGLRSSEDFANSAPDAGREQINIASQNHGTSGYRPVLTVTYTAGGIAIPVAQYYYNRLRRN